MQIECYQEVSLSSTQTSCEAEAGKDWDITCYGYKDYTELPKAVHCGKLWCSDGFEDASEEKGPYSKHAARTALTTTLICYCLGYLVRVRVSRRLVRRRRL